MDLIGFTNNGGRKMRSSIIVDQIVMNFFEKNVLDNICLDIQEGEIFGLLGPSGAGKTTLIKILTGQLKQTSGTAEILGIPNIQLDSKSYTQIGMVLDQTGLYERLSCYDNLALFAEIYSISKSKIKPVLEKVGLEEDIRKPVSHLSKGMKQRLVLARAIMHQPKILFLDEPTSALDPATSSYIHHLILEEKTKGTSIFLTTHNMEEASKLCDRIALLHQGKILENDTPQAICNKYNHQNKIQVELKNGEIKLLENQASTGSVLKVYFENGAIKTIHSMEPNLETIFMELTGRKLV